MAREKDEQKRQSIIQAAKKLFAEKGFHGTSVADIVAGLDMPVGSVYTYFENKEEIIRTIIQEGWENFITEIENELSTEPDPERKVALIVYKFLPRVFEDTEFISLFLSEASRFADLQPIVERLTAIISRTVYELSLKKNIPIELPLPTARAALAIYFLGSLDAIRLAEAVGLPLTREDVISFISMSVNNAFRSDLESALKGTNKGASDGN